MHCGITYKTMTMALVVCMGSSVSALFTSCSSKIDEFDRSCNTCSYVSRERSQLTTTICTFLLWGPLHKDDYTKRGAESTSQIEKSSAFAGLILFRHGPFCPGKKCALLRMVAEPNTGYRLNFSILPVVFVNLPEAIAFWTP